MPLIDLSMVNGVWTLKLSIIQTVGLAIITLFIGTWINKHAKILQKLCIPAPAIGALPFAFINAFLAYFKIINITFDSQLQTVLMLAFFTTIGLMASVKVLKKGGIGILVFFILCSIWIVVQNGAGIITAKLMGIEPIFGIIAGSVSMMGGQRLPSDRTLKNSWAFLAFLLLRSQPLPSVWWQAPSWGPL